MILLMTPSRNLDGTLFAAWYSEKRAAEIIQKIASHEDACALATLEGWSQYSDFGALWRLSGGRTAECAHWFMFEPQSLQWHHAERPHELSAFVPLPVQCPLPSFAPSPAFPEALSAAFNVPVLDSGYMSGLNVDNSADPGCCGIANGF
jgi:hypothetical protein